ncbi:uncharacterized protein LOC123267505 [Cotesia glomerata]|uniref:DUF4773 domain-containing protein n=1 Tax=Cotesia glomerata TaxID=32391 RepID=A0AAV7HSV2_COTGL|nr:uncharacterized protein LOC123267505 [Cotesia glomerata]KAH0534441.1 hypothetical protein KQX54_003919 [Cotesia glomerata]
MNTMNYYIFLLIFFSINSINAHFNENQNNGCSCINYNCGCCEKLNLPEIHGTVCSNFTYLSDDYGISLTITYNNYTLYNETISARNPPPICVGIPEFEKISAEICITFYDLTFKMHHFHCCSNLRVAIYHVIHKEINLGCFDIPSLRKKNYPSVIVI